jgi:hypothetical protein
MSIRGSYKPLHNSLLLSIKQVRIGPDAVEFGMVFTTPSSFVLDTRENIHICSQGGAKGLDRVPQANATPVYMDGFAGVPP